MKTGIILGSVFLLLLTLFLFSFGLFNKYILWIICFTIGFLTGAILELVKEV